MFNAKMWLSMGLPSLVDGNATPIDNDVTSDQCFIDFVTRSILTTDHGSLPLYSRALSKETVGGVALLVAYSGMAIPSVDKIGAFTTAISSR